MKYFSKTILIFFLFLFFLSSTKVFAANVFVSLSPVVNVGENFEVLINANSDGILINSINLILDYNQDLVSFSGYKNDDALIRFWVDSPYEKNGNIYMSGIIPGGVLGLYDPNKKELGAIPLVSLLFTAKKEGIATFSFIKTEILKHDGKGTELIHKENGGEVIIRNSIIKSDNLNTKDDVSDKEKPESFEITLLEPFVFGRTPLMIVFRANDNGSGIKEYKINEGNSVWKNAKSPQQISRGIFSRDITVRAFDFYDNFQDSNIRIPGLISPQFLWIIFILIIFCIWGYKMIKYKYEMSL
ncbi:MAG: cohesin domain-containing protein [Candidatus Paceibacterota bacterium]